jgi:hypothetical protein
MLKVKANSLSSLMVSQLLILKAGLFALSAALIVSTSSAFSSDELISEERSQHRRLARMFENINIRESLNRLFETPISEWEIGQWILAAFLLTLILWCCGCICGGNQRRRRSYYRSSGGGYGGGRSSGGGGGACSCVQDVLLCVCCYELCCRDCQDVPCFNGGGGGDNVYRREGADRV